MSTRHISVIAVLLVAILSTGCDTLNSKQYVIAHASPNDRTTIKEIVESSAKAGGLVDKTEISRVPDTIVYYLQPVPHFPVSLGARMVGDSAVVDLGCFHPGVGEPPVYRTVENRLTTALTNEFGSRLSTPDSSHSIPMTQ